MSISNMSASDWQITNSHYLMFGPFSYVRRVRKQWAICDTVTNVPKLFKTKCKASDMVVSCFKAERERRRVAA